MMFVSYTAFDAIGTQAGLSLLTKMTQSIWNGSFFGAAILSIFVFLSLAKIAMDAIIEHKYERALFEFARLAIVVVLFTVTGTATIFDMSILNFGYAYQAGKNAETLVSTILNNLFGHGNPKPATVEAQMNGVPLMAEIYAIPSDLAYQITNIMLNPQKTATMDIGNLVLDPKEILYESWRSVILSSNEPGKMFKSFAKCYDPKLYDKLNNIQGSPLSCDDFNNLWIASAQNIINQLQQQGNVPPAALQNMEYYVNLIKDGSLQNDDKVKSQYLGDEINAMNSNANSLQNMVYDTTPLAVTSLPQTNLTSKLLANAQDLTSYTLSSLGTIGANIATPVYFLEAMMIMVQEYAIAIMFVLLPLVVVVGLLPIFGNNYKLILKYAFSFFLIKLWIPVFWLIYVAMMDVTAILTASATTIHNGIHYIDNGIQYAITTFVGNTAYAQPIVSQTSGVPSNAIQQASNMAYDIAMANEANKYSQFNAILLSFFAVAIPGVFGSSATYLIGKETMRAGAAALAEGLLFMQKFGGMISGIAGGIAGGIGRFGGSIGRIAGTATRMGLNVVKSGISGVRNFMQDRQLTKELHRSELGGIAKDFGIKMRRSTPEEIREAFHKADVKIQDKGDGVTAFYRFDKFIGIRDKDGSYRGAKFMSEEERNRYSKFDLYQTYGVINTETGTFVQARSLTPINTDNRIGRIENTNIIKNLNKTM